MSLTPEQHATRATGIGGSEIAAIIGANPWKSAIDVYLAKTGAVVDVDNVHTQRGTFLEGGLRDWFSSRTGYRIVDAPTTRHAKHQHVLATPDGIVYDGEAKRGVLELKYPGWRTSHHWGEPGTDQIPEYYLPQVTFEMGCTGSLVADVAAFIDGDLQLYTVGYSEPLMEFLAEAAERFWRDCIEPRKPPPPDSSERYATYIRDLYPKSLGHMLDSTPQIDTLASHLRDVRRAIAASEETERGYENQIKAFIGNADGVVTNEGKITFKSAKDSTSVDWEAVARSLGADDTAIAKHTTIKPGSRRFIVPRSWTKADS